MSNFIKRLYPLLVVTMAACGSGGAPCSVGASVACACTDGHSGAQMCGDDGRLGTCVCDGSGGNGSGGANGGGDDTAPAPGGPTILTFAANTATLLGGDSVVFSAVLTHPSGLDQLAGGTLTTPDGSGTYGPFDAGAQKGAFALTLSWSQISQTAVVDFTASETRTFRAVFYDTAGRTATQMVSITLACRDDLPACRGVCLQPTGPAPVACGIHQTTSSTVASCNAICGAAGLVCVPYCHKANSSDPTFIAGFGQYALDSASTGDCAEVLPSTMTDSSGATFPLTMLTCCCH